MLSAKGQHSRRVLQRVLDRDDLIAEVLFGLIMALTFTGSLSIADSGRDDVRAMLIGALGCNLAWGLIDGIFYLFFRLAERSEDRTLLQAARDTPGDATRQAFVDALPALVAEAMEPAELDALRTRLSRVALPVHPRLGRRDWLGGLAVFLLVFLSTLPVALPFVFMRQVAPAMRVSNAIAVGMLFVAGCAFARCIGRAPWAVGLAMVVLGCVLVAVTIALGG